MAAVTCGVDGVEAFLARAVDEAHGAFGEPEQLRRPFLLPFLTGVGVVFRVVVATVISSRDLCTTLWETKHGVSTIARTVIKINLK